MTPTSGASRRVVNDKNYFRAWVVILVLTTVFIVAELLNDGPSLWDVTHMHLFAPMGDVVSLAW